MTETYTPLTDAELHNLEGIHAECAGCLEQRAAAEIRALRASEARLLAALKRAESYLDDALHLHPDSLRFYRDAIAAAEGRAEG